MDNTDDDEDIVADIVPFANEVADGIFAPNYTMRAVSPAFEQEHGALIEVPPNAPIHMFAAGVEINDEVYNCEITSNGQTLPMSAGAPAFGDYVVRPYPSRPATSPIRLGDVQMV